MYCSTCEENLSPLDFGPDTDTCLSCEEEYDHEQRRTRARNVFRALLCNIADCWEGMLSTPMAEWENYNIRSYYSIVLYSDERPWGGVLWEERVDPDSIPF